MDQVKKPDGFPYSMAEVHIVLAQHKDKMDCYHWELMKWLLHQWETERETCARIAEGYKSPYYHIGGKEIAAEIRSHEAVAALQELADDILHTNIVDMGRSSPQPGQHI